MMSDSARKKKEQRLVAFGLLVSFLFSLLPIEDEDKIRERSQKIPAHYSDFFSHWNTGAQGQGGHSHNMRAHLGTSSHTTSLS